MTKENMTVVHLHVSKEMNSDLHKVASNCGKSIADVIRACIESGIQPYFEANKKDNELPSFAKNVKKRTNPFGDDEPIRSSYTNHGEEEDGEDEDRMVVVETIEY